MTLRVRRSLLGLVALALFVAAVGTTWGYLNGQFQSGVPVTAVFSAPGIGQQLPRHGDVKVRGVLVGRIAEMRLGPSNTAEVHMLLDPAFELSRHSSAEIRSKTVFGQKWVELIPPDGPAVESFSAGDRIPNERTKEPLELERALQLGHDLIEAIPLDDLATVFRTLADGFSGSEEDARRAMDRGLVALRAVNTRSDEFDTALRQLAEFAGWLDQNDDDIVSFMAGLDSANDALVAAAPEMRANLQSVPAFFDDFAAFQERVEGDLGRLVERGATLAELLARHAPELNHLVVELEPFTTVWNSGLSQPCAGEFESDMTCWQVYQMPGLDSRGLYRNGEAPDADQPGDPRARTLASPADALIEDYLAAGVPRDLIDLLVAPTAGEVAP